VGVDARPLEKQASGWKIVQWNIRPRQVEIQDGADMGHKYKASLILAFLAVLAGCEKAPAPQGQSVEEKPGLIFTGFTSRGTHLGALDWEATARTAQVYQAHKLARAQRVSIRYFKNAKLISRAEADEAEINTSSNDILAWGNVRLSARNGVVLYTDRLKWENHRQRLTTDSEVRVIRGASELTGKGLVADKDLTNVEVKENVRIISRNLKEVRKIGSEVGHE
jgi:LPS export ABC transporter protein LptC